MNKLDHAITEFCSTKENFYNKTNSKNQEVKVFLEEQLKVKVGYTDYNRNYVHCDEIRILFDASNNPFDNPNDGSFLEDENTVRLHGNQVYLMIIELSDIKPYAVIGWNKKSIEKGSLDVSWLNNENLSEDLKMVEKKCISLLKEKGIYALKNDSMQHIAEIKVPENFFENPNQKHTYYEYLIGGLDFYNNADL